jgi:hypothetical protein
VHAGGDCERGRRGGGRGGGRRGGRIEQKQNLYISMAPCVPLRNLTERPATPCKPSPFEPLNTVLCVVPLPQSLLWSTVVHSVRRAVCVSAICRTCSPPPMFPWPSLLLRSFTSLLGGLITLRHTLPLAPLLPVFGCPRLALLSVFLLPHSLVPVLPATCYVMLLAPSSTDRGEPHLAETSYTRWHHYHPAPL